MQKMTVPKEKKVTNAASIETEKDSYSRGFDDGYAKAVKDLNKDLIQTIAETPPEVSTTEYIPPDTFITYGRWKLIFEHHTTKRKDVQYLHTIEDKTSLRPYARNGYGIISLEKIELNNG